MSVNTDTNKILMDCSTVTSFDFTFKIFKETDLVVSLVDNETQEITRTLALHTDYEVSISRIADGGTLTLTETHEGYSVYAVRTLEITQPEQIPTEGHFPEQTIENALDRGCMISQQLKEEVDRSIKMPGNLSNINTELPVPSAGKTLKWNETETGLENSTIDVDELESVANRLHQSIDNIDTVSDNITSVNTVAAGIADVIIVSEDKTNIDALANDLTNIDNVAADLTNIDAVAADLSNIDDVATDLTNINSVASDLTNIDTVSTNITNINSVNSNATNINSVASDLTNIDTVAADLTNINSVAGDLTNIDNVASNITNINAVNTNSANINSVSSNLSAVSTVSSNIADVNSVSSNITDVNTVADNIGIIGDLSSEIDYVNNSKALESGEVSSNPVIYNQILARKYSTFDLTKFTLVGNPTITDDGIMTETATYNGVRIPIFDTTKTWEFGIEFTTGATIGGFQRIASHYGVSSGDWTSQIILINNDTIAINLSDGAREGNILFEYIRGNQLITPNTQYKVVISFNGSDTYILKVYKSGELVSTKNVTSSVICNSSVPFFNIYSSNELFPGTIDLKRVYVNVDGIPVFTGTQGGTDEYIINGQTVSIPYTLSKTGSKVVDSVFRTQVAEVYSQEGDAPYFTLSDTDYTLPQGDLYGKIQTAYRYVLPDYANGITMGFPVDITTTGSSFTAPCAGWAYIHANRRDNSGGTLRVYVNGSSVAHFVGFSTFGSSTFFPVSKGDVIFVDVDVYPSWTIGLQGFYPAKGAD